jgi:hypothetical protein
MLQWNFKKLRPGDTTREPIQGEFFANEAISSSADALVREGFQNTLDAREPGKPAQVRVCISGPKGAVPPEKMKPYLGGLWPHITAKRNGLQDSPGEGDPCLYLAFEDFGSPSGESRS